MSTIRCLFTLIYPENLVNLINRKLTLQSQQLLDYLHLPQGFQTAVSIVLLPTACRSCLLKQRCRYSISETFLLPTLNHLSPDCYLHIFQATAAEVQTLLVSGRKKEALICAQEGHMWGPALVLAAQLGDQVISLIHYTFC